MIIFGIPLRSKAASKNWDEVSRIFNRTLASVYNQTDPNFRILVACHDIPPLAKEYDERVEFIRSQTLTPRDSREMMLDKGYKISMIASRIRELGGGYTMLVDSDDLISNRVAEYVNAHPNRHGFLSDYGYIFEEGSDYVKKVLALQRTCGSCSIVNYSVKDLPDRLPEGLYDESLENKYIIRMSHRIIPIYLKEHRRELERCPFPTTIYVRNTGDNHSTLNGGDMSWKRKAELTLRKRIKITNHIRNEFFGEQLQARK